MRAGSLAGPLIINEITQKRVRTAGRDSTFCGTPSVDGKYQLATYGELENDSISIGAKFAEFALEPQKDYIGIIGANSYEYDAIILGKFFQF